MRAARILLIVLLLAGAMLACLGGGGGGGNTNPGGSLGGDGATATYGAEQFHIQLTAISRGE
jgi:hypothetical protein